MSHTPKIRLAYSSCPNDTFIFKAIAKKMIDLGGIDFEITIDDVETLNQKARQGAYDVTKLSVAAFGRLSDTYSMLQTGAALGNGCGPLIISLPGSALADTPFPSVAVPGLGTTANHLFRFFMADRFPGHHPAVTPMTFERVMPAVLEGNAEFGVIIHEGRFVYQNFGLEMIADLGEWWENTTGMPIPLGCIAVKKDMDPGLARTIQSLIRESIDHALENPGAGDEYIRQYAQEMAQDVIRQHIELYVNHFSRDLGEQGRQAIVHFFERARQSGISPLPDLSFVAD
ncbi:MAG: 1,4-dihydroxy-6-naphthoate synthase [Desulfobacteraceae bacterium]|nr:MAG: 1,4-dihydroxy-6-naphthoate synthase [Desulfobacteraceae bacterium]